MITTVFMPKLGLTMEEGTIVKWHKQVGQRVEIGEIIFELESDKAVLEYESPVDGILLKILIDEDVLVPVATPVGYIGDNAGEIVEDMTGNSVDETGESTNGTAIGESAQEIISGTDASEELSTADRQKSSVSEGVRATPRARALAKKLGVPIECVEGSQEDGRISEDDVNSYHEKMSGAAGKSRPGDIMVSTPYDGIRRKIGEQLRTSCNEKPHIYQTVEVDMQSVIVKRNADKTREGSPSISDYIVYACTAALKEYPQLNSLLVNDVILQYIPINIGYAVDTPRGLIVPVIKNCGSLSLEELSKERKRMVDGALTGKLMPDDYAEGTFTISSLGSFGIQSFTSIINPPQTAILSVAALEERAVVRDGNIVIRPCMNLTMAIDHRIVDGAVAARALTTIKGFLESECIWV